MSQLLKNGQMQTLCNPFGTIFNPFSLNIAMENLHDSKKYKEEDLILYNQEYISLNHHTCFDTRYVHQTLERINHKHRERKSISTNNQLGDYHLWTSIYFMNFCRRINSWPTAIKFPKSSLGKDF